MEKKYIVVNSGFSKAGEEFSVISLVLETEKVNWIDFKNKVFIKRAEPIGKTIVFEMSEK